jgi:hypothetical protein
MSRFGFTSCINYSIIVYVVTAADFVEEDA